MPAFTGPFDGQVVINFTEHTHAPVDSNWLENRWKQAFPDKSKNHKKLSGTVYMHKIDKHEAVPNCDNWFAKDEAVRIYVLLHTGVGTDTVPISTIASQPELSMDKLADILKEIIGDQQNVVVNLIACKAARGEKNDALASPEKSIASKLHELLFLKTNRDIPIVARLATTVITHTGEKLTRPVDANQNQKQTISKQPKSKFVFFAEAGNQVQQDAYEPSDERKQNQWRDAVLSAIYKLEDEVSNSKDKALVNDWFGHAALWDPDELHDLLQKAQRDPEIQKKRFFLFDNPIQLMVNDLLSQASGLFNNNEYLPKRVVKSLK